MIAVGKAAVSMANAAATRVDVRRGLVVSNAAGDAPPGLTLIIGGHPMPTPASEDAGRRALALAESLGHDDRLLVLISGGASALLALPAAGVTLDDKRQTTDRLLRAGADIHALNTVRKHLSAIKGGWLAARTRAACDALVISDVVGDDLSVIASGPTVADASTFQEALDVLRRHGGADRYAPNAVARLRAGAAGEVEETPKPGDSRLARATTRIIGSRMDAMAGAADQASALGYAVVRLSDAIVGEARTAAAAHVRAAMASAAAGPRPVCVISSGETTVHVSGRGKGGRNQEFALAAAASEHPSPVPVQYGHPSPGAWALASVGTDGIDGPTDAAGAIADATTRDRARAAGLDPHAFLSDNNAYAFFDALGDLIHTGPTGTNVGDLQVFLLA